MSAERRSRLVVVSNRVAINEKAMRAGGLAVALLDALKESGGLWFGWSGRVSDSTRVSTERLDRGRLSALTTDLSSEDYEEYYNGFANRTLWPLFHYRSDLTRFDRDDYQGYIRVNQRFAHVLKPLLKANDLIWVHDYHLIAFGEELRRTGARQTMGFFLHIPFPSPEVLTALPVHDLLVRALFAYDVLGFQTESDRHCFHEYVRYEAGGHVDAQGRAHAWGRQVETAIFPVGIDSAEVARFAVSKEAKAHSSRMARVLRNRLGVVGVDRLDYTMGLPERFRAFARFLETYPENRGRVSFVQLAPPSRADVPEYVDIRHELEGLSGSVNAEYSEFDWTPLRYINRGFSRRALAGIFRLARVGLVTPLRDGMNLVAKEYVAAQSARDPGVLVLSRFAGAARQGADAALIVNPYDIQGVADALHSALGMSLPERKERWRSLVDSVRKHDITEWREGFVRYLQAAQRADRRH